MNLLERVNGTLLKTAAVFGFAALSFLVLVMLGWVARNMLGVPVSDTWEVVSSIIVLVGGASMGTSYASRHTVSKKE